MAVNLSPNPSPAPGAKRVSLILMGGAGLVLLAGGGLCVALNSQLTSLQTVAQQKETEVGGSEKITQKYQETLDDYTQTEARISHLETSVSAKTYVPTLLGQLQSLGAATHLSVISVRPALAPPPPPPARPAAGTDANAPAKKAPPPPPYDTLSIDLDVTGTYADTATFLYSLTRFPKIISVTSAQMRPGGVPAGASPYASPTVTTNLHLVAFMFHDDDTAAPGVATVTGTTAAAPDLMGRANVSSISGTAGYVERHAVSATKAENSRSAMSGSL